VEGHPRHQLRPPFPVQVRNARQEAPRAKKSARVAPS
jgi:hypothetical protein